MTITPPRGNSGTSRTASRNRRRRPQVPGEPRHAANGGPGFDEAPRRRPSPVSAVPMDAEGLGARLYEVMSESERETAVAETLLFVKPDFDAGPPAEPVAGAAEPGETQVFSRIPLAETELDGADLPGTTPLVSLAEAERAGADLPGTTATTAPGGAEPPPAAETILFTRPPDWETAAERYLAGRRAGPAPEPPAPVLREVSPLTETFLFGPPGRHAQEPRSPIDGAAETLLFAGLARTLATGLDETGSEPERDTPAPGGLWTDAAAQVAPAHDADWADGPAPGTPAEAADWADVPQATPGLDTDWADTPAQATPGLDADWADVPSGTPAVDDGWAGAPAYGKIADRGQRGPGRRRRAWADLDRDDPQPWPDRANSESARAFSAGSADFERSGRVVNRRRSRTADADPQRGGEDVRDLGREWLAADLAARPHPAEPDVDGPEPEWAADGHEWITDDPQGPSSGWGADWETDWATAAAPGWETDPEADPDAYLEADSATGPDADPAADLEADFQTDFQADFQADLEADFEADFDTDLEAGFGVGTSLELSPERRAKAAAAEAAWRAFAEGDRETEIRTGRRAKSRWLSTLTGSRSTGDEQDPPKRPFFLWPVLLRCLLYLGPLSVAVAGVGALGRVAWPVPAVTLLLGWAAAQALTSVGVTVSRRAGAEAAVRLVGAGFLTVTGVWCALVWIAPDALLGPDRLLAASVGAGGLATLATVTAALVTRSETALIRWYLPCWLLAGLALAAAGGVGWAGYVPVETLLPAAIVAALVRAFRPAVLLGRECRIPRLTAVERRRGLAYLVVGASQAICVALLWQAGPAVTPAPAALPLLLAVPMLEALIGWHTDRIDAGLDSAESAAELDRHVRNVTVITLAGLMPPLAAGGALALAAYRLPGGLSSPHGAVLALAAGTLLGGVFAVTFLLAARARTGFAAALAAAPPLATLALPLLPQSTGGPLPVAVAVLAATHVAGLLIVALTAADLRRTS
ncbi:hypothetical protein ACTOB_007594 [Actinoplanes oblitus]|uniref:Uncharacterized protein n=1 Tax=Actinoplanes oblitus TaxID=3040509 RepID=A0ABY8WCU2_9ACTN|nr:hypothetical protein [Actinoplanes oblitus]WIM95483.1 hypothetical protein ACTOB_007594 [Actinoplanes oblitus]